MVTLEATEVARLPVLRPGERILAVNATVTGAVVVLTGADRAAGTAHVSRDGGSWSVPLAAPPARFPVIDLLPDGAIVVVDARCRSGERNATVHEPEGAPRASFPVGDGVEQIGVDGAGTIWVSYFDEGVFGNDLAAAGLRRFSPTGEILWTFAAPSGTPDIADCYALNVDAHTTWIYYYTDFPLVRISAGRSRAFTPTPVRGARSVAVHRDDVLFLGGYGSPTAVRRGRLDGDAVTDRGGARLAGVDEPVEPVAARGGRLYVRTATRVMVVDLADLPG